MSNPHLVASIQQRLRNRMDKTGEPFHYVLSRFGFERLLYRLSLSEFRSQFVLKGALLFYVWNKDLHRPTRDMDFLGFGASDVESIKETFEQIVKIEVPDDGLTFHPETITVEYIREEKSYGGIRVKMIAKLGNSRIPIQIDIGFGDTITPEAKVSEFPTLLPDFPAPTIRAYPVYTVIAEKLEAMVSLGDDNSRMKDFFDVHFILKTETLDQKILADAIAATFKRRGTAIPKETPRCLTAEFAAAKQTMWGAFLQRNGLETISESFAEVIGFLSERLGFVWAR
jgi:predicted nucleotidyltransferase component of viral defense system